MTKVTQKEWDAMNSQEKYSFLKSGKKKLNTLYGADPKSKVGSVKVSKYFNISVNGVTISMNCLTESEAYAQADQNIEQWNTQ